MKIQKWDHDRNGPLTEARVRALSVPGRAFRVSRGELPHHAETGGGSTTGRYFVVSGRCLLTFDSTVELGPGEYAEHPSGKYEVRVQEGPLQYVRAYPLPRMVWRAVEELGPDGAQVAAVAVSQVVADARIVDLLASCWQVSEGAVYLPAGDEVPPGSAERLVERSIVGGEWPLRLSLPAAQGDREDAVGIARALSSTFAAACLVAPIGGNSGERILIEAGAVTRTVRIDEAVLASEGKYVLL